MVVKAIDHAEGLGIKPQLNAIAARADELSNMREVYPNRDAISHLAEAVKHLGAYKKKLVAGEGKSFEQYAASGAFLANQCILQ